jgi:hypothetical protein
MMNLESALEQARPAVEKALAEAREELAGLRSREAELLGLIQRAEVLLGSSGPQTAPITEGKLTLHQALIQVLRENQNEWMTVQELARVVNERGLYQKRDGSPVEVNQVHARTNNYKSVFEKDGPKVRLREEPSVLSTLPEQIILFRDDDEGFFEWLEEHPDGFFLNTERNPGPQYLVLHQPACRHFKGEREQLNWTKDYVKLCAEHSGTLEDWAMEAFGESAEPTLCSSCFG